MKGQDAKEEKDLEEQVHISVPNLPGSTNKLTETGTETQNDNATNLSK